jgi:ABC-type antimicrobial peptide transport system permease subunit
VERVRNTAAAIDPTLHVQVLQSVSPGGRFTQIQRGLFIGLVAVLLLSGASLLVSILEQLQERRRLLSVLVAVGARRATMGWSVLWQTTIPVVLGLGLATLVGTGLGAILLAVTGQPIRPNWSSIASVCGAAAGVVVLVTAVSLPALWRLMRPDGLRTE